MKYFHLILFAIALAFLTVGYALAEELYVAAGIAAAFGLILCSYGVMHYKQATKLEQENKTLQERIDLMNQYSNAQREYNMVLSKALQELRETTIWKN